MVYMLVHHGVDLVLAKQPLVDITSYTTFPLSKVVNQPTGRLWLEGAF